ncbi:DUF4232 domain-containing protein [Streptomyces sp. NPDC059578]|uniref:DUF4232 domain-containing protein n=1 Tax=unclassified Streptomyces TaxID=2593676 RepID=UPI003654F81C
MRVRSVLAASAVATSFALLLPATLAVAAPQDARATPTCREAGVKVKATKTDQRTIVRITVENTTRRSCVVDHVPTVTFGNLDGAAQPVPATTSRPYTLRGGAKAHAKIRTVKRLSDPSARTVQTVHVAADPSHRGASFGARALGSPNGVKVYEPVTTWWHATQALADRALRRAG